MNYLAHAYLSFNLPEILLGNMISDFVKGKKQFSYPAQVQVGIRLHRAIDQFTDTHEATRELKSVFRPHYRLYAGAFADVVYDHFLANDDLVFATEQELKQFTHSTYHYLQQGRSWFPPPFDRMFPYMSGQDWLYHYRFREGIYKSFHGLVRRAAYLEECETAFAVFNKEYEKLRSCYTAFFPELKSFSVEHLQQLLKA
ncbi:MAG: DUF479 domain-containing protein [Chitinophagaceae bacterium]|nr:DUF479 domain-containing protein [Chitinophagaceae bacterium]MBL0054992.1 DUF479 domain-containing protein [Chitinophagaceae bacterium]